MPINKTQLSEEQEIKERFGEDSLIFSFDDLDHKIAEAISYYANGRVWKLPTIKDGCLCKWTRVSEDRACGNHSPVIYRVRKIRELLNEAISQAKEEERERLLSEWQEEKPIESLEKAVADSANFGGINSYGLGYDQGYLDCANQIIKLLSQSKKEQND